MRKFTCKPSAQCQRRSVKAATSTADMLDAFEDRLAEFGVHSKTDVSCAGDVMDDDRSVEIFSGDYDIQYEEQSMFFLEERANK